MDIKIIVASHKEFEMPEDDMYLPLFVGAEGKEDLMIAQTCEKNGQKYVTGDVMTRDDSGEHISGRNSMYCELTGLYWAWKNLNCEYSGLVHYRRHFADIPGWRMTRDPQRHILQRSQLEPLLQQTDIVLPKKRNYYITSIYDHYAASHYEEHLKVTREVLARLHPNYLVAYDDVMKSTSAHMFNMMIMKKEILDAYCEWLFPLLFEIETHIDSSSYDAFQKRYPGRLSELLLDVWIQTNHLSYKEVPVRMMGKVQWGRKIWSFLCAKFFKKQYRQGF